MQKNSKNGQSTQKFFFARNNLKSLKIPFQQHYLYMFLDTSFRPISLRKIN